MYVVFVDIYSGIVIFYNWLIVMLEQKQFKSTVLILGGTNFMGKTLLDTLSNKPYRICCINRGKIYWNNQARINHPNVQWFCADRKDHKDYGSAIRFAGRHLGISSFNKWAAVIDFCGYKWRDVQSAVKAVEGLTEKYIFISTDSVYNNSHYKSKQPIAQNSFDIEKQYQKQKKDKQSSDQYGYDKMKCQLYLKRTAKVPFICLRLPDVFGPFDNTDRFWTTLTWMLNSHQYPLPLSAEDQTSKLSFVDSESVASCIANLISAPLPPSNTYNLASKELFTLQEFLSAMQQILNIKVNYIATTKRSSNHCYPSVESGPISSQLAIQQIGWQPLPLVLPSILSSKLYDVVFNFFQRMVKNTLKKKDQWKNLINVKLRVRVSDNDTARCVYCYQVIECLFLDILLNMINMQIEGEAQICLYPNPYPPPLYSFMPQPQYTSVCDAEVSQQSDDKAKSNLTEEQQRVLKRKQERNILVKIQKIVQKVVPIHQAEYESQNQSDMRDLIEEIERMDIE